jgi:hypothetical protein
MSATASLENTDEYSLVVLRDCVDIDKAEFVVDQIFPLRREFIPPVRFNAQLDRVAGAPDTDILL